MAALLVGGILGGIIVCRMYKLDAWTLADLCRHYAPLALCLGRCANFVNGELGQPTDLPWVWSLAAPQAICRVTLPALRGISLRALCALLHFAGAQPQSRCYPQGTFIRRSL